MADWRHLDIELLGGFSLRVAGVPLTSLKSRKAEAMVAYLACEGRPLSRQDLAGFFWHDSDREQASANLRKLLSELRGPLAACLLINRDTVALEPESYRLDVAEFNRLVAAGDEESLAAAAALYQGSFLTGFYLRDSLSFDEWATLERERFQQIMLAALRQLTAHHLHRGQYEQGLHYVTRWLALDSLVEEAHRLAMRLHARRGRRNAALAQYAECQSILETELAARPTSKTTGLYERIRDAPPEPFHFPQPGQNFIGREVELSQISRQLDDPAVRLLTITGPGGAGKSRLAWQAAARCASDYRHGVYLVALSEPDSAVPQEFLLSLLATALNLSFSDKQPSQKQLLHYLREKEMLLLFDNFEHLTTGAGLLAAILDQAAQVKCLVTSRLPLQLAGESILQLAGLPYPRQSSERPERYPALMLFEASARQVAPDFLLTAENTADVIHICQLVDGLPLGLELAARAVRAFSPAQIASQLQHDLDFLGGQTRDMPDRHRSLRHVFDYTWGLLPAHEQSAFTALSVFPGPFTAAAAQAVTGITSAGLRQLAGKALLQTAETDHYQMQNLLRRYGLEKLAQDPGTAAQIESAHARYYAGLLDKLQPDLENEGQNASLQTIGRNLPHVRRAWHWAVEQADIALLGQILAPLGRYLAVNGFYQEAAELLLPAVSMLARQNNPTHPARLLYIRCLLQYGAFLDKMGEYESAGQSFVEALAEAQRLDARLETAACYREQGSLAIRRGLLDQAEHALAHSLRLFQEEGDEQGEADVWHKLGQMHIQLSQPEQAQNAFDRSLALYRRLANPQGIARTLSGLAVVVHYWSGAYQEAEPLYLESLALKRELGHRQDQANDLNNLGNLACNLKDFERAITYYEESLAIKRDMGVLPGIAITLSNLGTAYQELGQYERASALYEESLGISQKLDDQVGILFCLANLAELAHVQQQYGLAERRWRRVLQRSLASQTPDRLLYCLAGLSNLWADPALPPTNAPQAATMLYYVQAHPGSNQSVREKIGPPLARLESLLAADVLADAQAQAAAWQAGEIAGHVEALLAAAQRVEKER